MSDLREFRNTSKTKPNGKKMQFMEEENCSPKRNYLLIFGWIAVVFAIGMIGNQEDDNTKLLCLILFFMGIGLIGLSTVIRSINFNTREIEKLNNSKK